MLTSLLAVTAAAQSWTVLTSAQARAESTDNPSLLPGGGDTLNTTTVSASAKSTRSTEATRTRADLELVASPSNRETAARANGSVLLSHTLEAMRHNASISLNLRQEQIGNRAATASDVALGRGRRISSDADLGWGYALHERLSAQLRWTDTRTRFAQVAPDASDLQSHSASAALSYLAHETGSLGLTASRTQTSQQAGVSQARIDNIGLSAGTQWGERTSLSLSAGWSRTARQFRAQRLVCPLPISYCNAGLVPFVSAPLSLNTSNTDVQYSASLAQRLDEVSGLGVSVSRALSPGGFGVGLEDTFNLNWNRSFSDTTTGLLSFAESRSRFDGPTPRAPSRLRSVALSLSKALSPDLSLNAGWQQRAYEEPGTRSRGVSRQVSIWLQYQGPRVLDRP
jgi:hypothetical protein